MSYSPYAPGTVFEEPPGVILWARVYSGLLGLTYVGVAVLGIVVLVAGVAVAPTGGDQVSAVFLGVLYTVLGVLFAIPSIWAAAAPRKRYSWYLNMVMICIGMTSCACLPFCIPLLIHWLKPETKAWYGV